METSTSSEPNQYKVDEISIIARNRILCLVIIIIYWFGSDWSGFITSSFYNSSTIIGSNEASAIAPTRAIAAIAAAIAVTR